MEEYNKLIKLKEKFKESGNTNDEYACLWNLYQIDKDRTYGDIQEFRIRASMNYRENENALRKSYFLTAKEKFDDFCIALEWEREISKQFYQPRRKQLLPIVKELQRLADDELDLLAISCPPGIGKSTLAIFFLDWLAGKNPNSPILGGSHSNSFLRGVYDECLRIIEGNGEYNWQEIFTGIKIASTNAKDMRIDLDRQQRFETLEFSSIGSGNAGKVRAGTLLYCDDLVDGIETAMSRERLDKLWQQYTDDLRQRKIGKCKELHIATRWSVHDVIGRLEDKYANNDRAKFIKFAAVNENDESNFNYPYDLGFTTEFYHQQREMMDDASWRALYMNEPIEREGQLYNEDELNRYFDLPEEEPDAILAVCDTKTRGTDYCVMPIAYQYGENFYIEKIICDDNNPEVVEPKLIDNLIKHKVKVARFESNSAGGRIAAAVQEKLKEKKANTKILTKYTTTNKETRIIVASPFVKEHFYFKDESLYSKDKEYRTAMKFLCSYTMTRKNKHDDVPDAFSMLADFIQSYNVSNARIEKRPF